METSDTKIVFFGGEPLGVPTLQELKIAGIIPSLIVCNPDRPAGRGQKLTPPPVKVWAEENDIEVFQPTSYKDKESLGRILNEEWDLFVVVAYNFILPKWFLELPKKGVINVHPSLLPKLRGASPIRTAILEDRREDIGVSIMLMDEKMDHGPILDQTLMEISDKNWPVTGPELDSALAQMGGAMLADVIPAWLKDEISPQEQKHDLATYTKRFTKEDAKLTINPLELPTGTEARQALNKIAAFSGIGDAYFEYKDTKVKIKQAELATDSSLRLLRVTPAGKAEMDFTQYLQSISL